MTPQSKEQIRQANRAGVRVSLIRTGMDPDMAERWCALWETEATRRGITSNGDYFWDGAKGWIDAQRASTQPLR